MTLSVRESQVAGLVADGLSNAEIAARLEVTVKAVEKQLSSVYRKLGFSSSAALRARRSCRARSQRKPQVIDDEAGRHVGVRDACGVADRAE